MILFKRPKRLDANYAHAYHILKLLHHPSPPKKAAGMNNTPISWTIVPFTMSRARKILQPVMWRMRFLCSLGTDRFAR